MNNEENKIEEVLSSIDEPKKKSGKKTFSLGIIIALLIGGTVFAGSFFLSNGDKIGLASAFMRTGNEQSDEIKMITKNNEIIKHLENLFEDSYEIDFSISESTVDLATLNFINDKKSEVAHLGFDMYSLFSGGLYITNDINYLEIAELVYSFDSENAIYSIAKWAIEGQEEYLSEEDLTAIESINGIDLNYNAFKGYDENLNKEMAEEIEKYTMDLFKDSNTNAVEETLLIDGSQQEVTLYEFKIDLEEYIREIYKIQAKHMEEGSFSSMAMSEEQVDLMFEQITYGNSVIKIYEYDNLIVKAGLESSVIDKVYSTEMPYDVYFTYNTTNEMLNDFSIDFTMDGENVVLYFKNDLFNEDSATVNATVFVNDVKTANFGMVWDYTSKSNNLKIVAEDYEMGTNEELICTLAIIDDVFTFEYTDQETGASTLLTVKEFTNSVQLPSGATNLYDQSFEEFIMGVVGLMYGGMY